MNRRLISTLGLGLLGIACSSDPLDSPDGAGGTPGGGGGGGLPGAGGATPGAGGTSSGGAPSAGGAPTGGTLGSGGTPSSGGAPGSGGNAGAAPGAGGALPGGGGSGTGGDSTATGGADPVGSGGSATGGTGGEPIPEPTLVTSGPSGWWQVGEVTEGGTNASVTVNDSQTYQNWHGFGGTFNEKGWEALKALTEAEREEVMRLLFDKQDGCGFTHGRIPIGSSDYALDRYSLAPTANDYEMNSFSIARDKQDLIPYIQAAQKVNPNIRFWASPWSPPPWMKDNNAFDRGNMKSDAQTLQAHALYLARFVEAYAEEGIIVEAVHPQNEPGYPQDYPSCLWSGSTMTNYISNYLGPLFAERLPDTEIWLGTMSNPTDSQIVSSVMGNQTARGYVSGIGLQWGMGDDNLPAQYAQQYQIPVMQTEHKCGNYPWVNGTNQSKAPNDHAYAVESWGFFKNWIGKNVNSYMAWNMVLDTVGRSLDTVRPWAQNALLTVDVSGKKLVITPTYYVFRHLAQYVEPGAVRVGLSGGDGFAFKNPDGSIVTILYNQGGQPASTTLSVGGTLVQFSIPAQGWATVNWQG